MSSSSAGGGGGAGAVVGGAEGVRRRFLEVQRITENQTGRCKQMLKKLKAIQLQEMEEFGEKQLEAVVKLFAEKKRVLLKESAVPEFLQKRKPLVPPPFAFEEEDYEDKPLPPTIEIDTKHGLADIEDTAKMIRHNVRELLLASVPLGKEEVDTDSASEHEEEVEAVASGDFGPQDRPHPIGYLPVEFNPSTYWAKCRMEIISRFSWLKDSLKMVDQRLVQQDQLLQYIKINKPCFKFDDAPRQSKPVIIGSDLNYASISIFRERDRSMSTHNRSQQVSAPTFRSQGPSTPQSSSKSQTSSSFSTPSSMTSTSTSVSSNRSPLVMGSTSTERTSFTMNTDKTTMEPFKLKILDVNDPTQTARRCLSLIRPTKQRKVLQIGGIHNVMGKTTVKPLATTLCSCLGRTELCVICSGRADKVKHVRPGAMARSEATALLDHNYHKVLSTSEERPVQLLVEASLKSSSWDKMKRGAAAAGLRKLYPDESDEEERFPFKLLRTSHIRPPQKEYPLEEALVDGEELEEDIKLTRRDSSSPKKLDKHEKKHRKRKRLSADEDNEEDEEVSLDWSPKKSPAMDPFKKRRPDGKYDIDHIVIPYSIAAATRVEKIEYKEIDIPSWRVNPVEPMKRPVPVPSKPSTRNTRNSKKAVSVNTLEVEDTSLEAVTARHARSEIDEKKRFLNTMHMFSHRRNRKSETKFDGLDTYPCSPLPTPVEISENIYIKEEILTPPPSSNQISAADASLAVTALKISAPLSPNSSSRRRTVSFCKLEEEECDTISEPSVTPFESRVFPLNEAEYEQMVKEMKEAYAEEDEINELNKNKNNTENADLDILTEIKQEYLDEESDEDSDFDDPDWRETLEPKIEGKTKHSSRKNGNHS